MTILKLGKRVTTMSRDVYFFLHPKYPQTHHNITYRVMHRDHSGWTEYLYNTWNKLVSLDHLQYIVEDHRHVEFKNTLKEENEDNG